MQREELIRKWTEELQNANLEWLELMTKLFGGISNIEKYNVSTTPERIEEIKALEAQQEAEKKAKREQEQAEERRKRPNPYALNPTMVLLGHQCTMTPFDRFRDMYSEVMAAHPYEGTFGICIDMFSLGIICGKRIDRQRRKERAANRGR